MTDSERKLIQMTTKWRVKTMLKLMGGMDHLTKIPRRYTPFQNSEYFPHKK
jgi:hypothetical protein